MKNKHRKILPSPARWMAYSALDDNCWGCDNRNACGSCKRVREENKGIGNKKHLSTHDKRQLVKEVTNNV